MPELTAADNDAFGTWFPDEPQSRYATCPQCGCLLTNGVCLECERIWELRNARQQREISADAVRVAQTLRTDDAVPF
jgi:hypothetical protein